MSLQIGHTPLYIALVNGYEAMVEVLLKTGADHSITDKVWFSVFII